MSCDKLPPHRSGMMSPTIRDDVAHHSEMISPVGCLCRPIQVRRMPQHVRMDAEPDPGVTPMLKFRGRSPPLPRSLGLRHAPSPLAALDRDARRRPANRRRVVFLTAPSPRSSSTQPPSSNSNAPDSFAAKSRRVRAGVARSKPMVLCPVWGRPADLSSGKSSGADCRRNSFTRSNVAAILSSMFVPLVPAHA